MLLVWKPLRHVSLIEATIEIDLPIQASIKLFATSRNSNATFADLAKLGGSDEATDRGLDVVNRYFCIPMTKLTAIFLAASLIFSTLISEKPLTLSSLLVVVAMRPCKECDQLYEATSTSTQRHLPQWYGCH